MAAGAAPTNMQKEQMFGLAEKEMEHRVDLFNRIRICEVYQINVICASVNPPVARRFADKQVAEVIKWSAS
ncbi:hypothetical protein Zm00014a_014014 [Zea mays]|uniref:Uncharacterized protein n=1 Tax=Zea mays TaxID=4577 RepID=A0A3L6DWS1_MAIZE|nr:hypothetical protein Zm00014a_014014 [Zea mays]